MVNRTRRTIPEFVRILPDSGENISLQDGSPSELELLQVEMEERIKKSHEKGFGEGREFQKRESLPAVNALSNLMKEVSNLKRETFRNAEREILDLAFSITEKVIHQEVSTNRSLFQGSLKEAIKNIVDREGLKVRLNPEDFRYMMEVKTDFLQSIDGIGNILFEEDPTIKRGGVIVETLFGEVEARLENQLNEVRTAFYNTPVP